MFTDSITVKEFSELESFNIHVKIKGGCVYFYCEPNESSYIITYTNGNIDIYGHPKLEQIHTISNLLLKHKGRIN